MQRIDMKAGRTIRVATAAAMMALALLSGCADEPAALVTSAKEFLAKNDRAAAIVQLKNALQSDGELNDLIERRAGGNAATNLINTVDVYL